MSILPRTKQYYFGISEHLPRAKPSLWELHKVHFWDYSGVSFKNFACFLAPEEQIKLVNRYADVPGKLLKTPFETEIFLLGQSFWSVRMAPCLFKFLRI